MSTSCSLEPVTVALFGKELFVDGLIDLQMRAYWIIQPELQSNDRRHTEERSQVKMKAETGGEATSQGSRKPSEAERAEISIMSGPLSASGSVLGWEDSLEKG